MHIIPKLSVEKTIKKFTKQQKLEFDNIVKIIITDPLGGVTKRGDLAGLRIYKFKLNNQLMLLAYIYNEAQNTLHLLKLGPHENFYRDLKH
jgi:mRNA-degrading endonuclease YafQ of YafQ-DinJ toxin-antitoxin module